MGLSFHMWVTSVKCWLWMKGFLLFRAAKLAPSAGWQHNKCWIQYIQHKSKCEHSCKHCKRHSLSLPFWLVDCKFDPSVSNAFISYNFSHQLTPHAFPSGITCISCQFGHQMGILALVTHLATRWIHFASDLCNFALHSFCNKSSKFSPKKGGSCFFQQWVWGCSSLILSGPGAGVTLQLTLVPG